MARSGVSDLMGGLGLDAIGGLSDYDGVLSGGAAGGGAGSGRSHSLRSRLLIRSDGDRLDERSEQAGGGALERLHLASHHQTGGRELEQLTQAERADMQAQADRYVQVITSGEEPFQIVWASEAWLKLCEYETPQVLGHTLELIQGPLTSRVAVEQLMGAIRCGQPATLSMINHTRTGKPFSHTLRIEPLRDSRGNVQCFQATSASIDTNVSNESAQAFPQGAPGSSSTLAESGSAGGGGGGGQGPDTLASRLSRTEGSMKRTSSEISISGMLNVSTDPTRSSPAPSLAGGSGRSGWNGENELQHELQISEMLDLFDAGERSPPTASPRRDSSAIPGPDATTGLEMLTFPPSPRSAAPSLHQSPRRSEPVEGGVAEAAAAKAAAAAAAGTSDGADGVSGASGEAAAAAAADARVSDAAEVQ